MKLPRIFAQLFKKRFEPDSSADAEVSGRLEGVRRVIVGVIGGDEIPTSVCNDCTCVGAAVTKCGQVLLTGGSIKKTPRVKHLAMDGANQAADVGNPARLIGVLGEKPRNWDVGIHNLRRNLFLQTALGGRRRNPINGVTADVLIVFPGSTGTLSELAFGLQAGRPFVLWKARDSLLSSFEKHERDSELDDFLKEGLNACRHDLGHVQGVTPQTTVDELKASLRHALSTAVDFQGGVDDLVSAAVQATEELSESSGFPGFRDDPQSKQRFENILIKISA